MGRVEKCSVSLYPFADMMRIYELIYLGNLSCGTPLIKYVCINHMADGLPFRVTSALRVTLNDTMAEAENGRESAYYKRLVVIRIG